MRRPSARGQSRAMQASGFRGVQTGQQEGRGGDVNCGPGALGVCVGASFTETQSRREKPLWEQLQADCVPSPDAGPSSGEGCPGSEVKPQAPIPAGWTVLEASRGPQETKGAIDLFMFLFTISVAFLKKHLFKSFAYFFLSFVLR